MITRRTPSVIPEREDSIAALKRRLYLLSLAAVAAGAALLWAFPPGGEAPLGAVATSLVLPAAVAFFAGCLLLLWRRPASLPLVERGVYWAAYPIYLSVLALTVGGSVDVAARQMALHTFALWVPMVMVWAFLAFGSRRGLLASFAFLGSVGVVIVALGTVSRAPTYDELGVGLQLSVSMSVFILVLYAFTRILEGQIQARAVVESLAAYAARDLVTDLPNRLALEARFDQARALAHRSGQQLAVCFIDLDDFKRVNDTFGHAGGDAALRQYADRLSSAVRESDTVARVGGDEFVVLAFISDAAQAPVLAQKLLDAHERPITVDGREVRLSASVGVSVYPFDGSDGDTLLRRADETMYRVKAGGKNAWALAEPQDDRAADAVTN
jgi:diguanylate cyclase (GGDEF)-like protein